MAAVGIVGQTGRRGTGLIQTGLDLRRQFTGHEGGAGHVLDAHGLVGAGDAEHPGLKRNVLRGRLLHMGDDVFAFVDDLPGGDVDRRAAQCGRARGESAGAGDHGIGVAVDEADVVGIQAEPVAEDLLEGGLMTLAVVAGPHQQGCPAGSVKADFRSFQQLVGGLFDGVGNTDAAQFAAGFRLRPAGGEAVIVGQGQTVFQVFGEIAAVVGKGEPRLERHGLGRDGVEAADFGAVDAELAGRRIDHALNDIGRFRPPGAAIGAGTLGVGHDAGGFGIQSRRPVGAGDAAEAVEGAQGGARGGVIGADSGDVFGPQA